LNWVLISPPKWNYRAIGRRQGQKTEFGFIRGSIHSVTKPRLEILKKGYLDIGFLGLVFRTGLADKSGFGLFVEI